MARLRLLRVLTTHIDMENDAMKPIRLAAVAAALCSVGIAGAGPAVADDYTLLIIDPGVVFDTMAYAPGPVTPNPSGRPGAATTYTHRDGRTITETVWVLPDPAAAAAATAAAQSASGIVNPRFEPVPVGNAGTFISGTSADGKQALGLVTFTEGNAAAAIAFAGPANDPPDAGLATDLGQAQVALIKNQMGG